MDVHEAFQRAGAGFEAVVAGLGPADWERGTVCEVPVRELVWHVVAGNHFAVRLLEGASATEAVQDPEQFRFRPDPLREIAASCSAQAEAFGSADRSVALHHPFGDIDYDTFVRYRLGDLVVHAWDIASAVALNIQLDLAVVEELWRRVAPHLDEMRATGTYGLGASGSLPANASARERLLDAFGRRL